MSNWVEILPIVLLGIWIAIKKDLNAMVAEMIHGVGIQLPGEFFVPPNTRIEEIKPQPITRHSTKNVFIFRELATSPYILLRNDVVHSSLQTPYDRSYKVIQRGEKNFIIKINKRNVTVSRDPVRTRVPCRWQYRTTKRHNNTV